MFGNRGNTRNGSAFDRARPVCQFYLEGRCRFGDNCKNEHPAGRGAQNSNRFQPLDGQSRGRNGTGSSQQDRAQYKIEPDLIKFDLTTERPVWPLSSYGPGKNPPRNLIPGDLEHSPEEMRLLHYIALASGNPQETSQREASMMANMDSTVQRILADLNGAVKYVVDGFDQHPNRIDMAKGDMVSTPAQPSTSFGQASGFGQSSTPQSAFGQPSALGSTAGVPQSSSFGQPSALGSTAGAPQSSSFGQPSFGQPSQPSGFGQAGQTPAFGQSGFGSARASTSTFGQPSAPQSTFGQPSAFGASAPAQQSTFGQPSAFGAAAQTGQSTFGKPSAFGAATQTQQSAFGKPSSFGAASNAASPFASTSQPGQTPAFGAPSAFGAAAQTASPFASTSQQKQTSAFGQPSAFGAAAQTTSPFASADQIKANPFASNTSNQTSAQNPFSRATSTATAFGQPSQPSSFGQASQQPQASANVDGPLPSYLNVDASGALRSFKGRPVTYNSAKSTYTSRNPQTGKDERVWFPKGPPKAPPHVFAADEWYQGEIGQQLEKMYRYTQEHGVFENGIMPEIPPQRAWVSFDI